MNREENGMEHEEVYKQRVLELSDGNNELHHKRHGEPFTEMQEYLAFNGFCL